MGKTCKHNIFTHFPEDLDCDICKRNKPMKARGESKGEKHVDALPTPQHFGDAGTLDHKVINEDDASREGDRNACVILDRATYWLQAYGDQNKSAKATISALPKFYGPKISEIVKHIYSDNSKEIKAACEHFSLSHDTSTPHRSETNGIAENAVRRVKEGTSCTLHQSGLCDAWWKEAMMCFCFLKNVVDILWTNKTSYCMRFKEDFRGPIIPFGVEELVRNGHKVIIETNAGLGSGFDDQSYIKYGAKVVNSAERVFNQAELIIKVKEPQKCEYPLIKKMYSKLILTRAVLAV